METEIYFPKTHEAALSKLIQNSKLREEERKYVKAILSRYQSWWKDITSLATSQQSTDLEETIEQMVNLLNQYKLYVEKMILESPSGFLYRQKGQTKVESSIIEEFIPLLVYRSFPEIFSDGNIILGSSQALSKIWFESSIKNPGLGGFLSKKDKKHDFIIGRRIFIRTSYEKDFREKYEEKEVNIAYLAVECKTNLDKTMFQEAIATATDVKSVVPGAKYFIVCEWLDMEPVNTAITPIDAVFILRKAKRMPSEQRRQIDAQKEEIMEYSKQNPIKAEVFKLFIDKISELIQEDPSERSVLERGYF